MNGSTKSRHGDPGMQGYSRDAGSRADRPGVERAGEDRNGTDRVRDRPNRPAPRGRLSGSAAVEHAKSHLTEFTGPACEGVSSLVRTREGWRVVLEVLELERIPRTTDILASYMVELDENGELMSYERIQRYCRNDVGGDA